jgi:hypothetical protein
LRALHFVAHQADVAQQAIVEPRRFPSRAPS